MLILTHIGRDIPSYVDIFISQLKKFNFDYNIIFLVNQINCEHEIFKKHKVKTYPIESLISNRINNFISNFCNTNNSILQQSIDYGGGGYWCVTAARLFFIYEYCLKYNIKSFFHFENDIMLYEKLQKIESIITENNLSQNKILITRGGDDKIMTGFMYVGNLDVFNHLLTEINYFLESKLDLGIFGVSFLNEMGLLHVYQTLNPDKMINLPIFPNKKLFFGLEIFKSVFDPATYGQSLDGIPSEPGKGILPADHIISREVQSYSNFKITFKKIDNNKVPYIFLGEEEFKINCLHIHSKRLELFLS
jgi:hypothetical protein